MRLQEVIGDYLLLKEVPVTYASIFLSVIEKISLNLVGVFCFRPCARSLHSLTKIHNGARSLQENLARSAANQSARTIVAIQ